jgi:C4-type Zn-finger protein
MKPQPKPCPICHKVMTIKRWLPVNDENKLPFYSIYCRHCGYGLQEAFNSRGNAIRTWNKETLTG